jgi:hypothetical protein
MQRKTAVLAGPVALAIAALSSKATADSRWQPMGSYGAPSPAPAAYYPQGGSWYYAYRPVLTKPEGDRVSPEKPPRPDRINEVVYANVEAGYQSLSISTLTAVGSLATGDIRPASVASSGGGAFYGIGGGFRIAFLTLGGRVRNANLGLGSLSTIDGELGARITLSRFEPYFTFGAGYAKLGASGGEVAGIPDLDIHGWNARAGLGLDYYPDKNFTLGVNMTGDVLAMARPGVDLSTSPEAKARERVSECQAMTDPSAQQQCAASVVHDAEGASAGFAGTFAFVMGLHF